MLPRNLKRYTFLLTLLVVGIAIIRIVCGYASTAQTFDEPCHIAAAIELLERHTYTLDPVHPPLSRVAIGLPLYFAGKRYPVLPLEDASSLNYNVVGNHIIYDDGHYLRNLILARSAMLPFLIILSILVYSWSKQEFGQVAALISVFLLTTTPIVLALSSIAYTDLVTATTQFGSLFAFTIWLSAPTIKRALVLGAAVGLALLSKLTSLLFLPTAALGIVLCCWWLDRDKLVGIKIEWKRLCLALGIAVVVLWGGYGFSTGHVREEMGLSLDAMPSFQHFPGLTGQLAKAVVTRDPVVPAPALLRGFATAWVLNKTSPPAYLLGHIRDGGWWYFFLAGLLFKTPLPFLALCIISVCVSSYGIAGKKFSSVAPVVSAIAILLVTMPVKYNAGLRHVLVIFPLLAVAAGGAATCLWQLAGRKRVWMRCALISLLMWQGIESIRAQRDFISYFNEFGGQDPSRVMVAGCDLDCGQDVLRLSRELRYRRVSHLSLAVWSSADLTQIGLPDFDVLQPFTPVTGWVAVSARSLRFGDVLHQSYPPNSFSWLEKFSPIAKIGNTIWLYYIPTKQTVLKSSLTLH